MYAGWLATSQHSEGDPFNESAILDYLSYLSAKRLPASRGMTFRETINWMGGLFDFDVKATATSARVKGLAVRLQKTRDVLKQRDPLTVAMVAELEKATAEDEDDYVVGVAGCALFTLYSRTRVGDVARSPVEPALDLAPDQSVGYCQGALFEHKTAKPGSKQALPLVAPHVRNHRKGLGDTMAGSP